MLIVKWYITVVIYYTTLEHIYNHLFEKEISYKIKFFFLVSFSIKLTVVVEIDCKSLRELFF